MRLFIICLMNTLRYSFGSYKESFKVNDFFLSFIDIFFYLIYNFDI